MFAVLTITPRLLRTFLWIFAIPLCIEALHRVDVVPGTKNVRLAVFVGSLIATTALPPIDKPIMFNLALTYELAPLFLIARRLQY